MPRVIKFYGFAMVLMVPEKIDFTREELSTERRVVSPD